MTIFERIKAMSIEEMAEFIGYFNIEEDLCSLHLEEFPEYCSHHNCADCALRYLKGEVLDDKL